MTADMMKCRMSLASLANRDLKTVDYYRSYRVAVETEECVITSWRMLGHSEARLSSHLLDNSFSLLLSNEYFVYLLIFVCLVRSTTIASSNYTNSHL